MGHQHNLDENQNDDEKQLAPSSVPNKQQVMPMIPANTNDIEKQDIKDVPAIPLKPGKSPPPPRAPPGGSWGYVIHLGDKTCLWSVVCCFCAGLIPALIVWFTPFDKKRAYRSRQGEIYDEHGHLLRNTVKFQEEDPFRPGTDSDQKAKSIGIAIFWCLLLAIALALYIINYISNSTNDYDEYTYEDYEY